MVVIIQVIIQIQNTQDLRVSQLTNQNCHNFLW